MYCKKNKSCFKNVNECEIGGIDVLENSIKRLYKKEINPNGHEIIEGVSTEQLMESIDKIIIALGIEEYHVLSHEKIKEYNEYVQTTLKLF